MLRYVLMVVAAAGLGIGAAFFNASHPDFSMSDPMTAFQPTSAEVEQAVAAAPDQQDAAKPEPSEADKKWAKLKSPCTGGSDVSRVGCGFDQLFGGNLRDTLRMSNDMMDERAAARERAAKEAQE